MNYRNIKSCHGFEDIIKSLQLSADKSPDTDATLH